MEIRFLTIVVILTGAEGVSAPSHDWCKARFSGHVRDK